MLDLVKRFSKKKKKSTETRGPKAELVVKDGKDRDNNKKSHWECWGVLHAKNNLAVSV